MSRLSSVKYAFIVHRGMGCDDESATDDEQAEKILYYYPETENLNDQLNKINMVEGLIDFATKFSIDAISTVVMQQNTWAFFECEKNIWVIIAVDSQSLNDSSPDDFTHSHQANTYAFELSLRSLYSMYFTTHGPIQLQLGNSEVDSIQCVKTLRKRIRKLRLRLRQELQDLQSLVNREKEALSIDSHDESESGPVEHMGIRANTKTILQVQTEIDASNADIEQLGVELVAALASAHYTPVVVRGSVGRFMRWYMSSGELDSLTCLSAMKGLRCLQTGYTDPVVSTVNSCTATSTPANPTGATANTASGPYNAHNTYNTANTNSNSNSTSVGQSILSGHTTSSGGSGFSSTVLRMRSAIEQATAHKAIGSLMLYDGRLLWSDLDNTTSLHLSALATLQDTLNVRSVAVRLISAPGSVMDNKYPNSSSGGSGGASGMYFKKTGNPDADLEATVQKQLAQLLTLRGFVTRRWGTLNLEETVINPLLQEPSCSSLSADSTDQYNSSSAGGAGSSSAGGIGGGGVYGDKDGAVNIDVTEDDCIGSSGIFCPRIYATSTGGSASSSGSCIGRVVFYRHNRAMVVILLPDWDKHTDNNTSNTTSNSTNANTHSVTDMSNNSTTNPSDTNNTTNNTSTTSNTTATSTPATTVLDYKRTAVQRILQDIQRNCHHTRNMYLSDYLEVVGRCELSAYYSSGLYSGTSNPSSVSSMVDASVLDGVRGVSISGDILSTTIPITTTNTIHNNISTDTTSTISSATLDNACLVSLCCSVQLHAGAECAKLEKAFRNVSYSDETGAILNSANTVNDSSGSASGGSSSGAGIAGGASGVSSSVSTAAAYERIASAITIAEELQLGYTRPELPLSPVLRNVRFVYYNPIDCSLKVCGINSGDLSPLLCAPRHFRDYIIANIAATAGGAVSRQYVPLSQYTGATSGSAKGGRRVAGVVVDKLTDRAGYRFPASSGLLADCLEPSVVRALNDIWIELAGRELATPSALHTPVHEACLRVSTPQRGGVWVTGRNIGGRYLYMIIDKCVTMNDMYHAYEQLSELLVR